MDGESPGDLLYGLKSIALHLELTERQAEHLIGKALVPTFKLGTVVCATKSGLARHFAALMCPQREIGGCGGELGDRGSRGPEA